MKANKTKRYSRLNYYEFEEVIHDADELVKSLFDFFYCGETLYGTDFVVVMRANYDFDKNTISWIKFPSIKLCHINISDKTLYWEEDWDCGQTLLDFYGFFVIEQLDDFVDLEVDLYDD